MDKDSKLEKLIVLEQQLPNGYHKLSTNLLLVNEVNYLIPSTINLTLPLENETHITQVDEPLVDQVVDSIPSSVNPTLPLESEINTY